jgi:ribokinase
VSTSENALDVVVVGSLNIDLSAHVERHPSPGETVAAQGFSTSCGGKGANQAVAAARLGGAVAMIGKVGEDAHGKQLLDGLRADGVDVSRVAVDEQAPTGTALITVADSGENSIVIVAGANAALSSADIDSAASTITRAEVLTTVLEIPIDTVLAAVRAAAKAGTRVVLNLSPVRPLPDDVLRAADPLVVNEHEARRLLSDAGVELSAGWSAEHSERLRALGPRSVVVTLGADGANVAEAAGTAHLPALPVRAADTTGAGDAFAATLALRLSRGDTLADAAAAATEVSAYSVQRAGAQDSYPHLADLRS